MRFLTEYSCCGVDFYLKQLELLTASGRRHLQELALEFEPLIIEQRLQTAADFYQMLYESPGDFERLRNVVGRCRDIVTTLQRLEQEETLDEIELFEIKQLAFLSSEVRQLLTGRMECYRPPDIAAVKHILDPDNDNVPSFYIYDSYSGILKKLREEMRGCADSVSLMRLAQAAAEEEQAVLRCLTSQLQVFCGQLCQTLEYLAKIDLESAKAVLSKRLGLCRPQTGLHGISLKAAFNAEVKEALAERNEEYQPTDIKLAEEVCLLTGANMTGKSVVLKLLAMAQILFQAGFFVPAAEAVIQPVKEIFLLSGDLQSGESGLSSYAAEMLYADAALKAAKTGKTLILLDELARNTNPHEGRAIVAAFVQSLAAAGATALVTTHYPNVKVHVRRLKVKGIRTECLNGEIDFKNPGRCIDYTLEEDCGGCVPEEALRVAEFIGIDPEIIRLAREQL